MGNYQLLFLVVPLSCSLRYFLPPLGLINSDNNTEEVSLFDCTDMELRGQEASSCATMNITVDSRDIGQVHYYPEVSMTLYNPDPDVHPAAKRLQEDLVCGHTTSEVS